MTDKSNSATDDQQGTTDDSTLYYVTAAENLDDGDRAIATVDGKEIAIFRIDGEFHGVLNYCVHQGGPVCRGRLSGTVTSEQCDDDWELRYEYDEQILACPWHGWEFDVMTGDHVAPTDHKLPTYDVVVRDGDLYVSV